MPQSVNDPADDKLTRVPQDSSDTLPPAAIAGAITADDRPVDDLSAMARLAARTASTSKMPGEVVRPVSAARSGCAALRCGTISQ